MFLQPSSTRSNRSINLPAKPFRSADASSNTQPSSTTFFSRQPPQPRRPHRWLLAPFLPRPPRRTRLGNKRKRAHPLRPLLRLGIRPSPFPAAPKTHPLPPSHLAPRPLQPAHHRSPRRCQHPRHPRDHSFRAGIFCEIKTKPPSLQPQRIATTAVILLIWEHHIMSCPQKVGHYEN